MWTPKITHNMGSKRPREPGNADEGAVTKKTKKKHTARSGFSVGPANLSDGTYRRKGKWGMINILI